MTLCILQIGLYDIDMRKVIWCIHPATQKHIDQGMKLVIIHAFRTSEGLYEWEGEGRTNKNDNVT